MKIRTVTTGIVLRNSTDDHLRSTIAGAAEFNAACKAMLMEAGYEVQTTRVACPPFGTWLDTTSDETALAAINRIAMICEEFGVFYFNIGPARTIEEVRLVEKLILSSKFINASALIPYNPDGMPDEVIANEIARVILSLASKTPNGEGNFRFCASACVLPGSPFFPAGYNDGDSMKFAIGTENGDLARIAFTGSLSLEDARLRLKKTFESHLLPVQDLAVKFQSVYAARSAGDGIAPAFNGIDTSMNPTLDVHDSIAFAIEKIPGVKIFGGPGTLAATAMITRVLQGLDGIKTCGYSGLMLPPLEDKGLAQRRSEGTYGIRDLLLFSTVCGVGLDCVPISADDSTVGDVASILLDVASLANRFEVKKPLSCRLFPVVGYSATDARLTDFDSPYLCNTRLFTI